MAKNIYAMKDIKVAEFRETFISNDNITAVRGLDRVLQEGKSTMCDYPADFEMYYLGSIDVKTGKISCPDTPEFITDVISAYNSLYERMRRQGRENSIAGIEGLTAKLHRAINETENKIDMPQNVAEFKKGEKRN